jgi:hypothetical protein
MVRLTRLFMGLFLALLLIGSARWFWPAPDFHDGDIIFQTSRTEQSKAIFLTSRSFYTHMGILKKTPSGWVVIEAVGPVKETPLRIWTKRGKFGRIAVYRPKTITKNQIKLIFSEAKRLYGRAYDIYFSFDNRSLYCSEIVHIVYKVAGIELGKREKLKELGSLKGPAMTLVVKRSKSDVECKGLPQKACITKVMEREMVTPVSIARDRDLKKIYTNYPI